MPISLNKLLLFRIIRYNIACGYRFSVPLLLKSIFAVFHRQHETKTIRRSRKRVYLTFHGAIQHS